jgi:predicted ATP-grasp superfamily ATP-dependent carboligase
MPERELPPQPVASSEQFAGKQVVYARENGRIPPAFDQLVDEFNRPGEPPEIADVPRIGERIVAGQPVATVFACGATTSAVELELISRAKAVTKVLSAAY